MVEQRPDSVEVAFGHDVGRVGLVETRRHTERETAFAVDAPQCSRGLVRDQAGFSCLHASNPIQSNPIESNPGDAK